MPKNLFFSNFSCNFRILFPYVYYYIISVLNGSGFVSVVPNVVRSGGARLEACRPRDGLRCAARRTQHPVPPERIGRIFRGSKKSEFSVNVILSILNL